jgi:5-enolpyruvylshikimate-3-phosphate synthase
MQRVIEPLELMGARFEAREGTYLPLTIHGSPALRPIRYKTPVASAQVKSCVLLAGLQAEGETSVEEPLRSRDHTERMLAARGVDIRVSDTKVSVKGKARIAPMDMRVPGDISSAVFFSSPGPSPGSQA